MPPDLPGVRAQGLASLGVWPCSPRPWGLRGAQEGLRVTPGFQETCPGWGGGGLGVGVLDEPQVTVA